MFASQKPSWKDFICISCETFWLVSKVTIYFSFLDNFRILKSTESCSLWIRRTTLLLYFQFHSLLVSLFCKSVPNFLRLSIKQSYKISKKPWGCSFGCNNLFNVTCHTMNFQNCYQTDLHIQYFLEK